MRVPGQTGQESSYEAQEAELRAGAPGEVAKVYKDKASGPREHRPGQSRLAADAAEGQRPEGGVPEVGACATSTGPGQAVAVMRPGTGARRGHRPRYAALGHGFHRLAYVSAVAPRGPFGPGWGALAGGAATTPRSG